jgi:hypothetical protein
MYVVVWEPKRGHGGGHQLAMDQDKAERIGNWLRRSRPDAEIKVLPAEAHAAAAVEEHQRGRARR